MKYIYIHIYIYILDHNIPRVQDSPRGSWPPFASASGDGDDDVRKVTMSEE